MSDRFAKWMKDNPPLTEPQVKNIIFPRDNIQDGTGRNFYKSKGMRGIRALISLDTKKKLRKIAALNDVSAIDTGCKILTNASRSPDPLHFPSSWPCTGSHTAQRLTW